MSLFCVLNPSKLNLSPCISQNVWRAYAFAATEGKKSALPEDDFRVLNFIKKRERVQRKQFVREEVPPNRALQMPTDQSWPSVWPGPRTFHPSVVPLPVRQGYPLRAAAPPGPVANTELMKIPNFLHLTPPAIQQQCQAIKHFCTPWPRGLETEELCEQKFPIEVVTSDYCHSGPSIRNPLSRIVTLRLKLSALPLDKHARDKLLRLVGERYDESTDTLTIVTDRCPARKQNAEYAMYLLTAIFYESWKFEPWEVKAEADMEEYIFDNNASKQSIINHFEMCKDVSFDPRAQSSEFYKEYDTDQIPGYAVYKEAVSTLMNEGENDYTWNKYKEAAIAALQLSPNSHLKIDDANRE